VTSLLLADVCVAIAPNHPPIDTTSRPWLFGPDGLELAQLYLDHQKGKKAEKKEWDKNKAWFGRQSPLDSNLPSTPNCPSAFWLLRDSYCRGGGRARRCVLSFLFCSPSVTKPTHHYDAHLCQSVLGQAFLPTREQGGLVSIPQLDAEPNMPKKRAHSSQRLQNACAFAFARYACS